jgi:hypothetical protein
MVGWAAGPAQAALAAGAARVVVETRAVVAARPAGAVRTGGTAWHTWGAESAWVVRAM